MERRTGGNQRIGNETDIPNHKSEFWKEALGLILCFDHSVLTKGLNEQAQAEPGIHTPDITPSLDGGSICRDLRDVEESITIAYTINKKNQIIVLVEVLLPEILQRRLAFTDQPRRPEITVEGRTIKRGVRIRYPRHELEVFKRRLLVAG